MLELIQGLAVLIPGLALAGGVVTRVGSPGAAARITIVGALGSLIAAAAAVVLFLAADRPAIRVGLLRFDGVSATMCLLVSFLGFSILRFSRRYLAGDPGRQRFFSWMGLTLGAVLTLVLSGDLVLVLAAWVATSVFLHRLLLHYPGRPGAVLCARKKFVVSRLGDGFLLAAVALLHRHYGTTDLDLLFSAAAGGNTGPLPWAGLLLVACAALKSAQFPFHSWLPDTMETPTPVSAFMHAGIINAGGFLMIRLSPLLEHAPAAMALLAFVGALTAAFGAVVMLTQPSVKRSLAYSTIAQMGFMLMQCGIGAFGLALLHIVAHSLYKANAFLHSGSTVGTVPRAAVRLGPGSLALGLGVAACLAGAATLAGHAWVPTAGGNGVLTLVLGLSLAYGLARSWSVARDAEGAFRGVATGGAIAVASVAIHAASGPLFPSLPSLQPSGITLTGVGVVFAGLFVFQSLLWRAERHSWGRSLYVHALNGFYLGTRANRLLGR